MLAVDITTISRKAYGIVIFKDHKVIGYGLDLYAWPDEACEAADRLSDKLNAFCWAGVKVW